MSIFFFLLLISSSFVCGIVLTLILQYYVLVRFFNKGPIVNVPKKFNTEACSLPEDLKKKFEGELGAEIVGSSVPISLMLQFLFHELRHSDSIKTWLYKKLTLEFDELLSKTTIGKFFDAVTIRDMNLGTQFPDIKDISLQSINLDKTEGHIETIDLSINLDYTGNFLLSVDAKMKFGKTAYLSIKVMKISGLARLQFTRIPYTHWSFSFYNEPLMDLAVESHFQGRQLQSNITNLIVNQIKKAIKRKHTLPNYKIRYKPFFLKTDPGQLEVEENEIVPQGKLEVSCIEVSRLSCQPDITDIYCTFTLDSVPFICVYLKDNTTWVMLELTITKIRQQQFGVIFKQEPNHVLVESVTPSTAAALAGVKPGDILLSVENKTITNVSQISKIIKSTSSVNISLKIERNVSNYNIKTKTIEKTEEKSPTISLTDDEGVTEHESFILIEKSEEDTTKKSKIMERVKSNENVSKFAQTIGNFSLRKRKTSNDRHSNDGSNKSTPNASSPGTPQHHAFKQHVVNLPSNFILGKKSIVTEVPEIIQTDPENQETELLNLIEVHRGKEVALKSVMNFNDEFNFNLKESSKYLNINIWGLNNGKEILLGYTNIPTSEILNACCNSMLGHYVRSYSLLPPTNILPTSQSHPLLLHSGFEHVFCYGDILLSFVWNHNENIEIQRKICTSPDELEEIKPLEQEETISKHDFIRTQFHRTIHCDFCSKKIWLKDAVQCRDCGLCCHKKCVSKCQLNTGCIPDKSLLKIDSADLSQSDLSEVIDENSLYEEGSNQSKGNELSMKRVNSVNNLLNPGGFVQTPQSRSLPPSPQRTPARKHSIGVTNPFALCLPALTEIQNNPLEAGETINRLLEQIALCLSDENLMESARESGRHLYAGMLTEEKVDKINIMMSELKKIFDDVTNEHAELSRKINNESNEVEKAKLAFLLGQADAKIQSLSVLMLHYCSGLQQTQEGAT